MIEKIVLDYLTTELNDIPVFMEIPENAPKKFVLIEKTGSSMDEFIYRSTFAIQSYDKSMFLACSLNETIKEKMLNIIQLDEITNCRLNSDYNYTDTVTKQYRYQAVFDLVHY